MKAIKQLKARMGLVLVCLLSLGLILFSGYSVYSEGSDDPKVTPTPDPCSGCSWNTVILPSDAHCSNCYRWDEIEGLVPDYNIRVTCQGSPDVPKCAGVAWRCPINTLTDLGCSPSGCCKTIETYIITQHCETAPDPPYTCSCTPKSYVAYYDICIN
jgi:hypothetical protein